MDFRGLGFVLEVSGTGFLEAEQNIQEAGQNIQEAGWILKHTENL